jgi:CelD/BcsL family acetyltransferase involved in cellulose biosynthesis
MEVRKITGISDLYAIESDWTELLSRNSLNESFLSPGWVKSFWKAYGAGKELYILAAFEGNALVGVMPLMKTGEILEFIGRPHSDYTDVIAIRKKKVIWAFMKHLAEDSSWKSANLDEMPSAESISHIRDAAKEFGLHFHDAFANRCYSLENKDVKESLEMIDKRDHRRPQRHLEREGSLEAHELSGEERGQALELMFEQHIRIWAARDQHSMFENEENKVFFRELLQTHEDTVIWALNLNNKPIAIEMGFVRNQKYLAFCQSIDPAWSRNSPGSVLLRFIIEKYVSKGFRYIDLSRGAESYKNRFTNREIVNRQVLLNRSIKDHMSGIFYSHAKEFVMNRPQLHEWIRMKRQSYEDWRKAKA